MAVLDLGREPRGFLGAITRLAANFSLPLYSDHDCLAFHQLTVPKVKPGFATANDSSRVSLNSLSPAPCPSTREKPGHWSFFRCQSIFPPHHTLASESLSFNKCFLLSL
jgi:hypothetical protein